MRANLPSLTALRFLAAFCIVFAHARTGLPETLGEIIGYTTLLGMPLFFVLSGFVIHYNYGHLFTDLPATALSRFAIARVARIYPLFLVMLAYALFWNGLWEVWKGANATGVLVPAYLFNAFSWFPFWIDHRLLIHHQFGLAWSISTEWFFYCAYPLFAVTLTRSTKHGAWLGIIAICITFYCLLGFAALAPSGRGFINSFDPPDIGFLNSVYRWLFYVSPYSRIFEFLLGAMTAQLFLKWQVAPSRPAAIAAWSALLAAFVTVCFSRQTATQSTILVFILYLSMNFALAPFIAAVIFVTAARDRAGVSPWPAIMIILGEASYSLYLTHPIVLHFGDTAGFPSPYLRFPAVLLLSCALALASYFAIEVPGRRLIRAAGNLRPRPAVSVG